MVEATNVGRRSTAVLLWMVAGALVAGAAGFWQAQIRAKEVSAAAPAATAIAAPTVRAESEVAAGRYLVKLGGCNDCHTPGFAMTGGNVPESQWLLGDGVGHRGPWGTTYASNLRLFVKDLSADDFVKLCRTRNTRPPMPWASLHAMSDADLRAIHTYLKALGPTGRSAPEYVPPTEDPKTPYVNYTPVFPAGTASPAPAPPTAAAK